MAATLWLSATPAGAAPASPPATAARVRGQVSSIVGTDIVISTSARLVQGQQLYLYDSNGFPLAMVQVSSLTPNGAHVDLLSLEPHAVISVGAWVSDQPYAPTPPMAATATVAHDTHVASNTPDPATHAMPADPTKNFQETLKKHTRIYAFKGGKGGVVSVPAWEVANIASGFIFFPGNAAVVNPWLLGSTAIESYEMYHFSGGMNKRPRAYIEIVYWDRQLAMAYADYYVYKEATTDPARIGEIRRSIMAQKGVDGSVVLQVKISNRGPGTLQLAPFDWHVYLLGTNGTQVKAERYDEMLDKSLNPNQETQGYIYFPRTDPQGHSYLGDELTLEMDDIEGEHTKIHWDLK
jgi:hypothetical protein